MNRLIKFVISIALCFIFVKPVYATDYDVVSGYGFQVNGYICDSYIEGSVTGTLSGGSTVRIQGWYINGSGKTVSAGTKSSSTYLTWYKPSYAYKWGLAYVTGTVSDGTSRTTRQLEN